MFETELIANQSSVILQKEIDRQAKDLKIAIGLTKSLVDEGNKLKKMDSTRILGSETVDANQDHKRRCFENLVVLRERITPHNAKDVKCALEAEVVDDTALFDATFTVTGFKNRCRTGTDVGYGNHPGNDGKKRRNKGVKKQGERCSMKCLNEKKSNSQVVKDNISTEKKASEGKGQKGYRKVSANLKFAYQRKDSKNLKVVATGVEETDIKLKVSVGIEKELTTQLAETETETVNEQNNEAEDQDVYENTTVGSKKLAYSKEEIEALQSVDEEGQKSKWIDVYSGFAPSVAREYTGLVADANIRLTQRYNRAVNCGSTRHANAMPPALPLCSSSYYI